MGKGRDKRRRRVEQLGQRTKQEEEIVGAIEAEYARSMSFMRKRSASRPPSDPILGEPDALVSAPLKPRPNRRSGAIAIPEPESENEFMLLKPRSL
jgi:hypothetical protein